MKFLNILSYYDKVQLRYKKVKVANKLNIFGLAWKLKLKG